VFGGFAKQTRVPGWFAASVGAQELEFAHGQHASSGKPAITLYGSRRLDAEAQGLHKAGQDMHLGQYQCAALLKPGEYQLLLVEAPNVPKDELKSAIRWRIKDMIDYHIDDATVDVLDIPELIGLTGNGFRCLRGRGECARCDEQRKPEEKAARIREHGWGRG